MQVHGHEVMQMMLETEQTFTKSSLVTAIETRFGANAQFFTCSAQDMDAATLVDFLAERGKFIPSDDGFQTSAEKICSHQ